MLKKIFWVIVCLLTVSGGLRAQDVEFSQYFMNPLHLNPALAGISYGPRVSINYRNQWPGFGNGPNGGFVTYTAGVDYHIEAIRGGVGLHLLSDHIAGDILVQNQVALMYSYQLRLSDNVGAKLGIQGSYSQMKLDWTKLQFGDQIDPITGFYDEFSVPNPSTEPVPDNLNVSNFDAGLGFVIFSEKLYAGFAVKHIVKPSESFRGDDYTRPVRFAMHAGAQLPIRSRNFDNVYFAPNVLWVQQQNFTQLNAGAFLNVQHIWGGAFVRYNITNVDAVIGMLGVRKGIFRMGYSYDISVSKLWNGSGGSHEVSLILNFAGDNNSLTYGRGGILNCPDILTF